MTCRTLKAITTAALFACAAAAFASGTAAKLTDRIQLHGFLSQSALHTSDNNFYGDSDDGVSTAANEAGLNAMLKLTDQLRLNAQAITRNGGKSDHGEVRTDLLNLDWQAWHTQHARLGARVGRVRNPYGLYNETRDVAHARPSIYVPNVIYLEQARDALLSRDGYALYGDVYNDYGSFSLELGYGEPRVSDNLIKEALQAETDAVTVQNPQMKLANLTWDSPAGHWRLGLTRLALATDVDYLIDGTFDLNSTVLSVQYSTEAWQMTFEYLRFDYDLDFDVIGRQYPGEGAYLQYTRFINSHWQVYARYEYGVFDRNNRTGASMRDFCGNPLLSQFCYPEFAGFRRDSGIGVRWDITDNWMTAAEAHYFEGTMGTSFLDNPDANTLAPYWTLLGIEIGFRF